MSWTTFFPVFDETMLDAYREGVSREETAEFEEWFGIKTQKVKTQDVRLEDVRREEEVPEGKSVTELEAERSLSSSNLTSSVLPSCVSAPAARPHIVAATLFWKHVNGEDPDLPPPTRESIVDARRMGLVRRFAPWGSYVAPLFDHTAAAVAKHPEVTFRLYLASDLDLLADELAELGWEICLMKSPSIRYCPGGFWRFLALEEDALVTVIDTDRMNEVGNEIARTQDMHCAGLGLWRVPGYYNADFKQGVRYRPILGGHFGAHGGIPIRQLIEAFIWHGRHGTLPLTAKIPGHGEVPLRFTRWPDYGFDEVFQLMVMYPWLAPGGTLTFIPPDARSLLLPADIEYAMWANPRSEAVYF